EPFPFLARGGEIAPLSHDADAGGAGGDRDLPYPSVLHRDEMDEEEIFLARRGRPCTAVVVVEPGVERELVEHRIALPQSELIAEKCPAAAGIDHDVGGDLETLLSDSELHSHGRLGLEMHPVYPHALVNCRTAFLRVFEEQKVESLTVHV